MSQASKGYRDALSQQSLGLGMKVTVPGWLRILGAEGCKMVWWQRLLAAMFRPPEFDPRHPHGGETWCL